MEINYLAILVAATISMPLGFLWYGPVGFQKLWVKLMGWSKKEAEKYSKECMPVHAMHVLMALISAFFLANILVLVDAKTWMDGVLVGAQLWAGFSAPWQFSTDRYGRLPIKLSALNLGYQLLCLICMGALLVWWPW